MYPTSDEFKQAITASGIEMLAKVEIDLAGETHLSLDSHDIMENGLEITDSTSESGTFQVGAAIINQLTLTLNNFENKFSKYDFCGAVIKPYAGVVTKKDWHGDTVEYVPMGVYTVDDPSAVGSIITITALDNMAKLDIPYSKSTLTYPATLKQIAENACSTAGVVLVGGDFLNSGYSVAKRPADEKRTCREILSYVAQLAGCFARCSRTGEIEIKWYTEPSNLWNVGYKASSVTTGIFDTEITGVDVTGNDDKKTIYKSGTEDYAISISDNPLVQNSPQTFADSLGAKFIGMKFRTYSSTSLSNPAVEAGDIVNLTDAKGNTYKTFVSNLDYKIGDREQYSADAESPTAKHQQRSTVSAQVLQKAHEEAEKQISTYDETVKQLSQLMINAMGFYETVEKQPDGAEIDYMHDKPNLADSTTVWKRTVDGIAVSTDGGHTFTAGITADGNAVVKVLTAIGINADWIIAGMLKSRSGTSFFDLDGDLVAAQDGDFRVCLRGNAGALLVEHRNASGSWDEIGSVFGYTDSGKLYSLACLEEYRLGKFGNDKTFAWKDSNNNTHLSTDNISASSISTNDISAKSISSDNISTGNGFVIRDDNIVYLVVDAGNVQLAMDSSGFTFSAGGEQRVVIDAQGVSGWINGVDGIEANIHSADGHTYHFNHGLLYGVD